MSDPAWFRPGVTVRLNPASVRLDGYPQTAVLEAIPGHPGSSLAYPRGDGTIAYVRPEHVEPVAGAEEPNYKRRFFL